MMLIGYARVSTGEQNLDMQLDALKEAGCERIFTDKISGTKAKRPGLTEMKNILRPGDTVVVWKMDRLFRSLSHMVSVMNEFNENSIQFRSLQEPFIDTTTASGKLIFHIMSALAEFEAALTRERVMAGLNSARARGRTGGRPKALEEHEVQAAARLMKDPNRSIKQICDMLSISPSTLYRYVSPEGEIRER